MGVFNSLQFQFFFANLVSIKLVEYGFYKDQHVKWGFRTLFRDLCNPGTNRIYKPIVCHNAITLGLHLLVSALNIDEMTL